MKAFAESMARLLDAGGLFRLLEACERNTQRLRVLTYHRVAELTEEPDLEPGLISATPASFHAEMSLIASCYAPVSLQQVVDAQNGKAALPNRAVLVTFDDGYQDFADNAWPIMKALRIPVALFVPTAYPDGHPQGFWWDRLHAALMRSSETAINIAPIGQVELNSPAQRRQVYKRLRSHVKSLPHQQAMAWVDETVERLADIPALNRVLSWDALRTLASEGVSICSHSREHALLTQLTADELKADLQQSLDRIRDEMGTDAAPSVLAYPANAVNQAVSREAQETGYLLSFGGSRGVNRLPVDKPQEVKRLPVLRYDQALYRAQLRPALSVAGGAISTIQRRLKA